MSASVTVPQSLHTVIIADQNYFELHSPNILIYDVLCFIFRCGMSKWEVGSFQKDRPLTVCGH